MLNNKFKTLCQNFTKDEKLITQLWEEIRSVHSKKNRYYHTLEHLEHIYEELEILNLTPLLEFAIFYHDFVYDTQRNNNEEQSALLAQKRLKQLEVPRELNEKVFKLIIETKTHESLNENNKLFLDADLSILGSNEKTYQQYIQNVRKEYNIYDDATYLSGRRKVLKIFLDKERIYESKHFYELYEKQARKNLTNELNSLDLL